VIRIETAIPSFLVVDWSVLMSTVSGEENRRRRSARNQGRQLTD
jgi:hypothetical protein